MCDFCGDMDRKHKPKRPLVDGAFGIHIVDYFQRALGITPVEAELLEANPNGVESNYRITFDDESVADYKFTFPVRYSLEIVDAEEYNRVI